MLQLPAGEWMYLAECCHVFSCCTVRTDRAIIQHCLLSWRSRLFMLQSILFSFFLFFSSQNLPRCHFSHSYCSCHLSLTDLLCLRSKDDMFHLQWEHLTACWRFTAFKYTTPIPKKVENIKNISDKETETFYGFMENTLGLKPSICSHTYSAPGTLICLGRYLKSHTILKNSESNSKIRQTLNTLKEVY